MSETVAPGKSARKIKKTIGSDAPEFTVTPEMEAERAAQDRYQAIANSRGRTSGTNATGDDLRRVAAKAGARIAGPVPADPLNPYFDPKVVDEMLRDAASGASAAGGGIPRGPRGRVTAVAAGGGGASGGGGGGSSGGFGEVTGPVHVVIDGQPVAVTWSGASPQSMAGGRTPLDAESAGHGADFNWTFGRASLRRQTRDSAQGVFGKEVERLRAAGKSDRQIKAAAKAAGLGVAAEAFFDEDVSGGGFGGGGGGGGR